MEIKNRIFGGLTGCAGNNRGVIGIQGRQGCNRYYHCDTGCSGVTYSIKTENVMNIYNYFSSTGVSCGAATPISYWSEKEQPTQTYAYGCFNESAHGGRGLTVTSQGTRLCFSVDQQRYITGQVFADSKGLYTKFYIPKSGIYEISYQVLIKDAAAIGARIGHYINPDIAVVNAESAVTELAATKIVKLSAGSLIHLELFSGTDTPVTLKGGVGAFIVIKLLYES